jgi:hypothetical protein
MPAAKALSALLPKATHGPPVSAVQRHAATLGPKQIGIGRLAHAASPSGPPTFSGRHWTTSRAFSMHTTFGTSGRQRATGEASIQRAASDGIELMRRVAQQTAAVV